MDTIRDKIQIILAEKGSGYVFTRKDFQDIGSSGSIGQNLSRMAKEDLIRKIGRGIYDFPKINPAFDGKLSPDLDQIANAIARKFKWTILPCENLAANRLGLSSQIPAKIIYLSNGPTKNFKIDTITIYFKHVRPKEIYADSFISGLVVQALKYFGKDRVDDNIIGHLRQSLSQNQKAELLKNIPYSTEWIYEVIQKIAKD